MIRLPITTEQILYAKELIDNFNFGNRGVYDGTKDKQLVGMLGQTVVCDYLGLPRPTGDGGFDGGYDFEMNGKKVDIKCMSRQRRIQEEFVHNLVAYQKEYNVDYYLFTSLNIIDQELEICGLISKEDFFNNANYIPKGTFRYCGRKRIQAPTNMYELPQYKLMMLGSTYSEREIIRRIA